MPKRWSPVKLEQVDDIVAEDWWESTSGGRRRLSRVAIGRPAPDPSGRDWYCPVLLEGLTGPTWKAIYGVGPVDAMMNALGLVRTFIDELDAAPSAKRPARKTAPRPRKTPPKARKTAPKSRKPTAKVVRQARRVRTSPSRP